MMMAGNWKMNLGLQEGKALSAAILDQCKDLTEHKHVVFCAPYTHLAGVQDSIAAKGRPFFFVGAQNCNDKPSGAYTGEISIDMLAEIGVTHVIIGHSERRQYFQESNEFLKRKTDALIAAGKQVIFCCGEPLEIREAGTQNAYVLQQLQESLFHLSAEQLSSQVVIAYEPIWAIGTGKTASTEQAQEMHAFLRSQLAATYSPEIAGNITLLYGGSCNASNAAELFACADVDGGLIGGAALKADTFLPIVEAMLAN